MSRFIVLGAIAMIAAPAVAQPAMAQPGGVPVFPPYQMRAKLPEGDRTAKGRDPKAVFEHQCGYCHLAGGMATNLLTKQMMQQKRPPSDGILANRKDLFPAYVKAVVRGGKGAMPAQTRVDITDAELEGVAAWLAKGKK
jgi:mono/diheme cytochrome c family protein